jgi:hypothetical protein
MDGSGDVIQGCAASRVCGSRFLVLTFCCCRWLRKAGTKGLNTNAFKKKYFRQVSREAGESRTETKNVACVSAYLPGL